MKSEIAIGLSFPPSHVVQSDTEIVATTSPGVGSASVVVKFSNDVIQQLFLSSYSPPLNLSSSFPPPNLS
eukprot:759403-Hanusia_phi.AAC.1